MPDRATLEAARPKCPVPMALTGTCAKPLRWHHAHSVWACPSHGQVLVPEALTARQSVAFAILP